MIDVENEVYTRIKEYLTVQGLKSFSISSEYVPTPAKFPHISVELYDTFQEKSFMDSADESKTVVVVFDVNVYSNKKTGKKEECRKIANMVHDYMYTMNFRRTSSNRTPNMADDSIYRITSRYEAVVHTVGDKNYFYRR